MESPKKSRKWYLRKVNEMAGHSSKYQKDYQNKQNTAHKSNINTHRATYTHRYTAHKHTHTQQYTQQHSTHTYTQHSSMQHPCQTSKYATPACRPVGTAYAIQKWSPPSIPNSPTTPMVAHTVLNRFPQFSTFRNTIKKDVTVVTTGIVQILSAL